jgi:hypothetical protein
MVQVELTLHTDDEEGFVVRENRASAMESFDIESAR